MSSGTPYDRETHYHNHRLQQDDDDQQPLVGVNNFIKTFVNLCVLLSHSFTSSLFKHHSSGGGESATLLNMLLMLKLPMGMGME